MEVAYLVRGWDKEGNTTCALVCYNLNEAKTLVEEYFDTDLDYKCTINKILIAGEV